MSDILPEPRLLVVMGVSGSGKSSVGEALAQHLGGAFLDGDSYHPAANIAKMSKGTPLTDEDRWPWLEALARAMAGRPGVVIGGCSALKRVYRDRITAAAGEPVLFVHLSGTKDLIWQRMSARKDHFMPLALLDSQFATLEAPASDENALSVPITGSVGEIAEGIARRLGRA